MACVNDTAAKAEMLPEGATVPVIRDLPLRSHAVMPERPVREVVELLFERAGAEAVALVDRSDRPVGLAVRARVLLKLSHQFGWAVFAKRPIAEIADSSPLVLGDETSLAAAVEAALDRPGEEAWDDVLIVDPEGRLRGLLPVRDLVTRQSTLLATVIVDRELARSRAAEAEETNRIRGQFLAHVTHELRAPVNALSGMLELIDRALGRGEIDKARERLAKLRGSVVSLRSLVNNILDLSKIEAGRMEVHVEEVDLQALLEEIADMARVLIAGRPVAVHVLPPVGPTTVTSDGLKVRQILVNLVGNAAKFTVSGRIDLGLETTSQGPAIHVDDSGPGIPPERIEALFEPFTQLDDPSVRRQAGTGLGLTIARNLAALIGGRIGVVSVVGEGSRFSLHLPARPLHSDDFKENSRCNPPSFS